MAVRLWGLLAVLGQRWFVSSSSSSRLQGLRASNKSAELGCSTRRINRRGYSTTAEALADDDNVATEEAEDLAARKKLEQALIELRIYSAAPDWLPLFPGGSYWIHPEQVGAVGKTPEQLSGPMMDPANEREILAMVTPMGWPVESAVGDAIKPEPDSNQ